MKIQRIAKRLDDAARHAEATPQLTGEDALTLEEAYAVQRLLIELRLSQRPQLSRANGSSTEPPDCKM